VKSKIQEKIQEEVTSKLQTNIKEEETTIQEELTFKIQEKILEEANLTIQTKKIWEMIQTKTIHKGTLLIYLQKLEEKLTFSIYAQYF